MKNHNTTTTDTQPTTQPDDTEAVRRLLVASINAHPGSRETLAADHGQVWDTSELTKDFEVLGFMAPLVVVRHRTDGRKGSLEFQHEPRFYFNFVPDRD